MVGEKMIRWQLFLPYGNPKDAGIAEAIGQVVNPSAFRIVLEGIKRADGQTILEKHVGGKRNATLKTMGYE